ncbi:MAG TPA: DNA mismatch repair protein MutS [Opitutae bacterium]|nr:DNA mismatch repair protein MutS [Opitutaceae bacterium]HCR29922.1 DNA mismatch repair protein MutS [Opitutae bacterium]|tara:strand:- start:1464 stop:1748 length:285 start_codon:yes stop_codon:yes gene_type:complete
MDEIDPVEIPINGELDLHTFRPSEVKDLLEDYFEACSEKGIASVRVIHGKGTGTLRETVHAFLKQSAVVDSFRLGDESSGSWGATLVALKDSNH